MKKYRQHLLGITVLACSTLLFTSVHAKTFHKWIDAQGNVSYSDTPPPKSAKFNKKLEVDDALLRPARGSEPVPEPTATPSVQTPAPVATTPPAATPPTQPNTSGPAVYGPAKVMAS